MKATIEQIQEYKAYVSRYRTGRKPTNENAEKAFCKLTDLLYEKADEELLSQAVLLFPMIFDHFSKTVPSKAKTDHLAWARLATNPKEIIQQCKKQVFAYKGDAVGFGGCRLHLVKGFTECLADGTVYNADGSTELKDWQPPNVRSIITPENERISAEIKSKALLGSGKDKQYVIEFRTRSGETETGRYNAKFFDELTVAGEEGLFISWSGFSEKERRTEVGPLVGISAGIRFGLLMPIRHG